MKKLLPAVFICAFLSISLNSSAQDYLITFAGTGAATLIDSVEVENLATGKTITLYGGDILNLTSVVRISHPEINSSSAMRIHPNPMMDNSILVLHPPESGDAVITVYDMTGKTVAKIHTYLENGKQEFRLSGLKNGMYLINVTGNSFQYSGKILSSRQAEGNPGIEKVFGTAETRIEKISKKDFNQTQGTVDMYYTAGERLKFKASSGIYTTIKTDIPIGDKTLSFNFIPCTDEGGNNYAVVKISTQIWMAENLRASRYNLLVTDSAEWAWRKDGYCWYNNDSATYNATYGALYQWISAGALCPIGWHVPSDAEWTVLTDYLGGEAVAGDKLKEARFAHWQNPNSDATNETGFTALPGGSRSVGFDGIGFDGIGYNGGWWSSTDYGMDDRHTASYWAMDFNSSSVTRNSSALGAGFSVRCLRDLPFLETLNITEITNTTAKSGGEITDDWGYPITARGVCWSSLHSPTISDSLTMDGKGTGAYTSSITGLTINTRYYVRAYITNSEETIYGNEIMFATKGETGSISDIDGNTYSTIQIGTQTWMAENLKTAKFNDGITIPLVTNDEAWQVLSTPGYCWYNNDKATNNATYGALYNWYTVNSGKLCPTGWHVPSYEEWYVLTEYLGGEGVAGGKLIEAGGATNETGFTALMGGFRHGHGYGYGGPFGSIGVSGYWWSSTASGTDNAWYRSLSYDSRMVNPNTRNKRDGLSIRCLRDE